MGLRFYAAEWHRKAELLPRYLTEEEAQDLLDTSEKCLVSYAILSNMAVQAGELLFPSRPKLHVPCLKITVLGLLGKNMLSLSVLPSS